MLTLKIIASMKGEEIEPGIIHGDDKSVRIYEAEKITCIRLKFADQAAKERHIDGMVKAGSDSYGMGDWRESERLAALGFILESLNSGDKRLDVSVIGPCECYVMNDKGATIERIIET